jgi:hypothetical protein
MQWDYLFLSSCVAGGILRPHVENDQELPHWRKGPSLHEYVQQLGDQGWEMVSHSYPSCGSYPTLVFKRPKDEKEYIV